MTLADLVDGLVHEPTQTEGPGLDLTVAGVRRVTAPGRVDFGGGELEAAETEAVEAAKRDSSDDYGWWSLSGGVYLLDYNERLALDDETVLLQPRDAVRTRGAFHPTLRLSGEDGLDGVPLTVSDGGLRLKENARVSTLFRR
jgi:hypothetical protein